MRTITKDVYTFSELSDKAKEKAISEYRDINVTHEWWSFVYDDAKHIGKLMGLSDMDISFNGFCSQGDGASFTASFKHKAGMTKAVKAYASKDNDLLAIAKMISKAHKTAFYKVGGNISTSGRYCHSNTMFIGDIYHSELDYDYSFETIEADLLEAFRYFADWIYKKLGEAYDYLTSDEVITQTIVANEYEFDIDGNKV